MRDELEILRLSEELAEEDPKVFTRRFVASLVLVFSMGRKRGFRRILSMCDVAMTIFDNKDEIEAVSTSSTGDGSPVVDLGDFRDRGIR